MKLLQNLKFTGPALLLLLVLNSTLLVLILMKHPPHPQNPPPPSMGQGGPKDFLIHELNLNDQQQKSYGLLIDKHKASMGIIQSDIRTQRDSLVSLLGSSNMDSLTMNSLTSRIGDDQALIEKVNFQHFKALRNICNPDQQPKFDSVIRDALRMMGPQQGGPNGPPPPRHPNGPQDGPPPNGPPPNGPPPIN